MASARSMPPSIASRRARKTCSKRGATYFANTTRTSPNAISPMMISPHGGISGFSCAAAARMLMASVPCLVRWSIPVRQGSGTEDEGDDEADQGQRLGEGEAEEGVGTGQAGRLRLTGGRLDVGGPHDADTDTGADGGQAVADRADAAGQGCENVHDGVFLLCRRPAGAGRLAGWCGVVQSGMVQSGVGAGAQCSASIDPLRYVPIRTVKT